MNLKPKFVSLALYFRVRILLKSAIKCSFNSLKKYLMQPQALLSNNAMQKMQRKAIQSKNSFVQTFLFANFRRRLRRFSAAKYHRYFADISVGCISVSFNTKFWENNGRNSAKFVSITFAQHCMLISVIRERILKTLSIVAFRTKRKNRLPK